jgi:hypothetical protein
MVCAVSKYSLLSILPPQSQFDWHNAVELQPITERRIRTIAQTFISALHSFETRILRFTVDHLRATGGYLATSVDQLVTLLLAKYAGEVVKALPRDKAYSPRGWENARRARLTA